MGSYIDAAIMPGETILHQGKVSLWSQLPLIILGFIFLPIMGIGILFWLAAFVAWWTTELAITSKRVIAKTGLISRRTVELSLPRVESIQVDQGIVGRLFNFGSIIIAGAGNPQAPIKGIAKPMDFRRACLQALEPV